MKKEIVEFLCENGCVQDASGRIVTADGDYVTYAKLDSDPIADLIYKHKLTDLQSISAANGEGCGSAVGIGFNKDEQKWYGFTHRGFGSFGIGFKVKPQYAIAECLPEGFECKTLEDCKKAAIAMSDYLD